MGFLSSIFGSGDPIKLTDQRTKEQLQAAQALQQLAMSGTYGDINLGQAYGGSLGSYTPTGFEQAGLSQLFNQQSPSALGTAEDYFTKATQAQFDPSTLEPFRKAAVRSEGQALDRLAQQKAITGTRFGTGFGRDASSLIEGTELGIQQQLANLFLNQQQMGLQAASGLAGLGGTQANIQQQQLQNMFNYGALERELKTQEAQAKYNEFQRQRNETLGRVDLLSQEAARNPYMGISEIPGSASPFSQLIGSVLGSAGKSFGEGLGTWGMDKIKNIFKKDGGSMTTGDATSDKAIGAITAGIGGFSTGGPLGALFGIGSSFLK